MLTFCVANIDQVLCLEVQYHDTAALLLVLRGTVRTLAAKFDQSDSVTFLKLSELKFSIISVPMRSES